MTVYLILLAFALALLLMTRINSDTGYVAAKTLIVVLTFLAMFRYMVGKDFLQYTIIFDNVSLNWDYEDIDPGFKAIIKLCDFAGGTSQLMMAIMALLTMTLIYKAYEWSSRDLILTLFVFTCVGQMYFNCFNAIRQAAAIAFFYFALRYVVDRNLPKFLICMLMAASLHTTAVLLIPLYWLINRKWNRIIVVVASAGLLLSGRLIIAMIANSGYSPYLTFAKFTSESSAITYLYVALSTFIFIFSDRLMAEFRYRNIFLNFNSLAMMCFFCFILFSGTPLTMVVTRINYYFMFAYAVTLPAIIENIDGKAIRTGAYTLLIAVASFMFINAAIIHGQEYSMLPFRFNFDLFV